MYFVVLLIVVAVVVALVFMCKLIQVDRACVTVFESRGALLTSAEKSFLVALEQALDSRYRIFVKVRLGDLLRPASGLSAAKRTSAQNRINHLQVDFVLCTANELALVAVVGLDDPSHGHEDRAGRDGFVDRMLAMAGIPVLCFPVKCSYTVQEVRAKLAEMMASVSKSEAVYAAKQVGERSNPVLTAIMESIPIQSNSVAPACPVCSAVMVKRQTVTGQTPGKYFWACSTFPRCRQVVDIDAKAAVVH